MFVLCIDRGMMNGCGVTFGCEVYSWYQVCKCHDPTTHSLYCTWSVLYMIQGEGGRGNLAPLLSPHTAEELYIQAIWTQTRHRPAPSSNHLAPHLPDLVVTVPDTLAGVVGTTRRLVGAMCLPRPIPCVTQKSVSRDWFDLSECRWTDRVSQDGRSIH